VYAGSKFAKAVDWTRPKSASIQSKTTQTPNPNFRCARKFSLQGKKGGKKEKKAEKESDITY
jgi:hypothetical protein